MMKNAELSKRFQSTVISVRAVRYLFLHSPFFLPHAQSDINVASRYLYEIDK